MGDALPVVDLGFSPTRNPTSSPTNNPSIPTSNPTSSPSKPTTYPTSNPTSNPTSTPSANPTNNLTSNPTSRPTKNPSSNPTSNPTSSPTNPYPTTYPTSTYKYLYFVCHYNDDIFTLYGKFMTLFEYAAIMRNVTLWTIEHKSHHSTNYDESDFSQYTAWRKAGVSYFEFCNVFSTSLNDECPTYHPQANYIAIARFEIVTDTQIDEYKTHLFDVMSTESFRIKFSQEMNSKLDEMVPHADRKSFEAVKIVVIDQEDDEVNETDGVPSTSGNPTIPIMIGVVIVMFVMVVVFAVSCFYIGQR
eukprot:451150_1